jgi:hypothetical protein
MPSKPPLTTWRRCRRALTPTSSGKVALENFRRRRRVRRMDPTAQAEAMAVEFATSVPVTDDEWLDAARRIIAAIEADLD